MNVVTSNEADIEIDQEDTKPRIFLSMVPVIDSSFLDQDIYKQSISAAGFTFEEQYVEWNTGWDFSLAAKTLSAHLVSKRIPQNINVLIKNY